MDTLLRRREMMGLVEQGEVLPPDGHVIYSHTVSADGSYRILNSVTGLSAIYIDDQLRSKSYTQTLTAGTHKIELIFSPITTLTEVLRAYVQAVDVYISRSFSDISKNCFYGERACRLHWDQSKITSIGNSAFFKFKASLGIINMPNLTSLGQSSFYNCPITKVENLGSVTTIPKECFRSSSCRNYALPATVTSIADLAFYDTGTPVITIHAVNPPTFGSQVFSKAPSAIYVPAESVEAYKAAEGWSSYASKIQAII